MKGSKGKTMWVVFMALLTVITVVAGCGNANKESGGAAGTAPAANVGADNCMVCHSALTHTAMSGIAGVNPDPAGLANAITHDCEACHGGGQYHFGSGPIPYPSPGGDRCAVCHAEATAVLASKHNGEEPANVSMIAGGHDTGKCQRCHTAEGSRAFASIIGDKAAYNAIVAYGTTPTSTQVEALNNLDASGNHILHNPVCGACHNALTKEMVTIAGWDPNNNGQADQFDLCTSCHVYNLNNDGMLVASGLVYSVSVGTGADGIWLTADDPVSATTTTAYYHDTAWYRIIASTHYDNPASPDVIEGYVIRKNGANPCFDCHGHELHTNTRYANTTDTTRNATPTVYTDWAQSGHGGFLLKAKYDVSRTNGVNKSGTTAVVNSVLSVGVTPSVSPAWAEEGGVGAGSSCARCHTATGAASYLTSQAAYSAATLDFTHRAAGQKEMLYCWGCHSNAAAGTLRTPGAFDTTTAMPVSDYSFSGAAIVFPDVSGSNICVTCHAGRRNRNYLQNGSQSASFRPHHAPTAGTLFSEQSHIVYEYDLDGDSDFAEHYLNVPYFEHNKIGTAAAPGTGTNGPCVACHMVGSSHLFSAVTKSGTAITAINNQALCNVCHTGQYAISPAMLEEESAGAQEASAVLKAYVSNTITNYLNTAITSTAADRRDYGALQNSQYLDEGGDPAAYVHNRIYAKRIIFDSIDRLDTGTFEGTIVINATTYPQAAVWFGAPLSTSGTYTATRP